MPKLRSLTLGDIHDLHHLIDNLRLPALEDLVINGGFFETLGCQTLTELFDRSGLTHLRSLSWHEKANEYLPYEQFRHTVSRDEDEDDFYVEEDDDDDRGGTVSTDQDDVDSQTVYNEQEDEEEDYSQTIPMEELIEFLKHPALIYLEELKLYLPVSDAFLQALHGPRPTRNRVPMGHFSFRTRPSPIMGPLMLPHLKNLVLANAGAESCSAERFVELAKVRMVEAPNARRVCSKLERLEIHRPLEGNSGVGSEENLESGFRRIAEECKGSEVTKIVGKDESIGVLHGTSYTIVAPPSEIRECNMVH
ncbi:hypothetical protein EST38_g2695 [Candolleomyces aberdarensis]|uniref:Uncharacterized protein n=1 Tax=Candolleomyces aberdarensis TaxID=2316362 RepID=A0A4Q2DS93_9AGAR|nr:hypothetical protein EST38_g2695 [Candolleomyces aberdarensis]